MIYEKFAFLAYYATGTGKFLATFYISLTVHLGIILANNQLHTLFQCIYLFHFSTCFKQPSPHHHENQCRSERNSFLTGIPGSHLHRVVYTRWCIDTVDSPDDEHWVCSKHVERWNK